MKLAFVCCKNELLKICVDKCFEKSENSSRNKMSDDVLSLLLWFVIFAELWSCEFDGRILNLGFTWMNSFLELLQKWFVLSIARFWCYINCAYNRYGQITKILSDVQCHFDHDREPLHVFLFLSHQCRIRRPDRLWILESYSIDDLLLIIFTYRKMSSNESSPVIQSIEASSETLKERFLNLILIEMMHSSIEIVR